ncbi:DNA mismatch repair protein MutS [Desulfallas sp. Bu1-1]|uniref:DNA mismatch repair protein MutS n=1 Tax=Desulfallas sp. Bu1-1 TaxID=2787620 RepID=UPI00189D639E|nr:DNA mismatch repair protein MutS [Desulfallas sp. Bu1-1]MBF7083359.1 DNA mismatch repair protein MutS [Desulfallas sp. Bu1-1]
MIEQYLQVKRNYQDCILFFRMGDFYEMFFDDAIIASKDLEITLTSRDGGGGEKVPMCGVPHHAAESYIARLIEKGRRVAICEQMEDPRQARGLVKREVIRVVTPGTVIEGQCLDDKSNNYLVSIIVEDDGCGLACTDVSTGLFTITEFAGPSAFAELVDEMSRLDPAEVLVARKDLETVKCRVPKPAGVITVLDDAKYQYEAAVELMNRQFGSHWLEGEAFRPVYGVRAAGAVICYLEETQKRTLKQINQPKVYFTGQYMKMDAASRRNLELTSSIRDGSRWGTLIWVLDNTDTAMGGRLLKLWLEQPLVDTRQINMRLDAVEELTGNIILRKKIKDALRQVYDLERLASRVAYGTANARDLLAIRKSFDVLPALKGLLNQCGSALLVDIRNDLDDMRDLNDLLHAAIAEEPPVSVRDGGIIKNGYHPEVDRLRAASRNAKDWLARVEAEEREKTGIKSLKVGYNKVFGYYLEVTKSNLGQVPDYYIRRQTLVNAERFITPQIKEYEEMIMGAEDRLVQLEYQLFSDIRQKLADELYRVQNTARQLAKLDALASLAEVAERANYVRPVVNNGNKIIIRDGRHPVVERVLGAGNFVPNDTLLDEHGIILLTGPNMAGKSTYMRQVALITLMAQAGSFVPSSSAEIGVVDRIFTRIGAADDLAGGRSTFMVEMSECREIVKNATAKSLIIMDEVGRGTSTYDGISIARALVEYIHQEIGARTLFSTHYHELTDLEDLPGVRNYTVSVREKNDEIIFLRKVLPGKVDRSYGIQVARLADLPEAILSRAKNILAELEMRNGVEKKIAVYLEAGNKKTVSGQPPEQCNGCPNKFILEEITNLDIMRLTPLDALNLLARWKQKIECEVKMENRLLQDIDTGSKN